MSLSIVSRESKQLSLHEEDQEVYFTEFITSNGKHILKLKSLSIEEYDLQMILKHTIRTYHQVVSADISWDGKYYISINEEGEIILYPREEGQQFGIGQFETDQVGVTITFSPDGETILFGAENELGNPGLIFMIPMSEFGSKNKASIRLVAKFDSILLTEFTADSRFLFCISEDTITKIDLKTTSKSEQIVNELVFDWEPTDDRRQSSIEPDQSFPWMYYINGFALDKNTNRFSVAYTHRDGTQVLAQFLPDFTFHSLYMLEESSPMYIRKSSQERLHTNIMDYSPNGKALLCNHMPESNDISVFDTQRTILMTSLSFDLRASIDTVYWITGNSFGTIGDERYTRYELVIEEAVEERNLVEERSLVSLYTSNEMTTDEVFNHDYSLELLKVLASEIQLPGASEYNNKEILRAVLIAYRDITKRLFPDRFTSD
jgi:hypothetical protein